ncbi:MAG: DUF2147 domain-containing protein [Acidocella sp.]|nr:DUF2147 domain-containing protein [Acidocella sp.]
MTTRLLTALVLLLAPLVAATAATPNQAPIGRWITANGQAVVQIAPCGDNLCGQIVGIALAHPGDPMPSNWKGQPQCGETIINTAPSTDANGRTVWKGSVLDPRNGNVYQANIKLDSANHLELHGYLVVPLLGQTQTWTPYAGRTLADCHLAANFPADNG